MGRDGRKGRDGNGKGGEERKGGIPHLFNPTSTTGYNYSLSSVHNL